ncbi:Uncharacterized protein RNJ44_03292 [Nakaseomyces bracarensis]|uniref:Swiss Army Knife RNA repair protein HAD domain-containing protein n=1 Tax=Nakaseomyces bracarensis TaxID=273131 RepID=A0ABR4NZI4_9SACH
MPSDFQNAHDVLKEWSSIGTELHIPKCDASDITKLHIYDFDNTLFNSPVPNSQLYTKTFENYLRSSPNLSSFGGWWDDPRPIETINKLMNNDNDRSEYWNENMIKLARMSYRAQDTISIVLTGRKEKLFVHHISKLLETARNKWNNLEDTDKKSYCKDDLLFNAVLLKKIRKETNTLEYKQKCILSFIEAYTNLKEITLYDDRVHHVNKFKMFFNSLNNPRIFWFVVPVPPRYHYLPIKDELNLVNKFIQETKENEASHPIKVSRTPMQVGYFLTLSSQKKLLHWALNFLRRINHEDKVSISNFAEYPMYIPCVNPGQKMNKNQVSKCLTKFDNIQISKVIDNAEKTPEDIIKYFCSHNTMMSEWSTSFKVVSLATREPTHMKHSQSRNGYKAVEVYYKVVPTNMKNETWTSYNSYIIIGYNYDSNLTHQISEINLLLGNPKILDWRDVRNGIKINTYFGFFSKKDCN